MLQHVQMVLLLLALLVVGVAQAQITLTQNGQSAYVIVRPADAIPSEQRAAAELQGFIGEVTGAMLPIVDDRQPLPERALVLGKVAGLPFAVNVDDLGQEGFVMRTQGERVYIIGGRPRGTLYGVYQFLEDYLGCRWYAPAVSNIPTQLTITLPAINRTVTPAFAYREPYYTHAQNGDWAARNRANSRNAALLAEHGGKIVYPQDYFGHSAHTMLPPAQYFAAHPEYYALYHGERAQHDLCYTNPAIVPIAIAAVRKTLKEHPETDIISVSQMDGEFICECPNCQAMMAREGSYSGPVLHFVNQVARAIAEEFPHVLVDTLAYLHTMQPPKMLKPEPNVVVRVCSMRACYSHPKTACPVNEPFLKALTGWCNIAPHVYVWDYVTNFQHYHMPFPDLRIQAENIRLYQQLGVQGCFMQGSYALRGQGGEFAELRAYLLAKLLWDPSLDPDAVINDFLQGYYGAAAGPIRQYIDLINDQVDAEHMNYHNVFGSDDASFLTQEILDKADALFVKAKELVKDKDAALKLRVEVAEVPILYARLFNVIGSEEQLRKTAARMVDVAERGELYYRTETTADLISVGRKYRPAAYLGDADGSYRLGAYDFHLARPRHFDESHWWVEIADDPSEPGKTVVHVPNINNEWSIQWQTKPSMFKAGTRYTFYIVARVDKLDDTGVAFTAGVYSGTTSTSLLDRTVTAAEMPNNTWQRIKIGEIDPSGHSLYFWSAPANNAEHVPSIFVDKFEIIPIAE
jgi:hypothetical protein